MIISASRRTDIPAHYSDWFFNRIKAGYAYVRNPMNPHQVSEISLSPDVVDGIVFWTKNPTPMMTRLSELRDYNYYFQVTITPYENDIEKNLPSKDYVIIPTFQKYAALIGKSRVIWRYDPIFLNEKYTMEYHKWHFHRLCHRISGYTKKCTISFLDSYRNVQPRIAPLGIQAPTQEQAEELTEFFSKIAAEYGIYIDTCAEDIDLSRYGVSHASCIDRQLFERIGKCTLSVGRDKNQRPACNCISSIDLGSYNTCKNNCVYCYANFNQTLVNAYSEEHDPTSPLLYGHITPEDTIIPREMKSLKENQLRISM